MQIVQNILKITKEHNLNNQQLCKLLKTNPNKIYDWKIGKSKPSAQDICIIADYLGVTTDYLLGRNIEIRNFHQNTIKNRIVTNGIADIIIRYFKNYAIDLTKLKKINELYAELSNDEKLTANKANCILEQIETELEMIPFTLPRMKDIETEQSIELPPVQIAAYSGSQYENAPQPDLKKQKKALEKYDEN